jgi:hypothetical protein
VGEIPSHADAPYGKKAVRSAHLGFAFGFPAQFVLGAEGRRLVLLVTSWVATRFPGGRKKLADVPTCPNTIGIQPKQDQGTGDLYYPGTDGGASTTFVTQGCHLNSTSVRFSYEDNDGKWLE